MFRIIKRNKKNIFFAVLLTISFYLIAGPIFYYTNMSSEGNPEVLGVPARNDVHFVVDDFVNNLLVGNFEHIENTTDLEGSVNFSQWHEVREAELFGEILYENEKTALFRVDFLFVVRDRNFEYPLTLIFIAEKEGENWIINDVEYTLSRYDALLR